MACHKGMVCIGQEAFALLDQHFARRGRASARVSSTKENPSVKIESRILCCYPHVPQEPLTCFVHPSSTGEVKVVSYLRQPPLKDDIAS